MSHPSDVNRRSLLRFLLASPLLLSARPVAAFEHLLAATGGDACAKEAREVIAAAADAINVFDFEAVAERKLPPAHLTYLQMGVQLGVTLRANRSAFDDFELRPRRLVDVRSLDLSSEVLGTRLSSPIVLAPAGGQRAFHPEGELAVARAARKRDQLMVLSTSSSTPLEDVVEARGGPVWFQLYTGGVFPITRGQLQDAEKAGCPAVALTVDNMAVLFGQNRDRIRRYRRDDNPECQACHAPSAMESVAGGVIRTVDMFGFGLAQRLENLRFLDWDYVDRIREATSMKLLIKGILTREDAALCIEHGVDGVIVSNHGGRAHDGVLPTIRALGPIVQEVGGRIPVLVDSGFRRGTDIFKALAIGADAVCVGRPYLWGLAAFGQEGVEAVLEILQKELELTMQGMGTTSVESITPGHVSAPIT